MVDAGSSLKCVSSITSNVSVALLVSVSSVLQTASRLSFLLEQLLFILADSFMDSVFLQNDRHFCAWCY